MQLVLIIAIGLGALVGEPSLRSELQSIQLISTAWAIAVAGAMPLITTVVLWLLVRRTLFAFDRGRSQGYLRAARVRELSPWLGLLGMGILVLGSPAIASLPDGSVRRWVMPLVCLGIPMISAIGALAVWYPLEQRMLAASTIRRLDDGSSVQPMLTRGGFVVARLRMTVLLTLAPIAIPVCVGGVVGEIAERMQQGSGEPCMEMATLVSALLLFMLAPLLVGTALGLRALESGDLRSRLQELAKRAGTNIRSVYIWPTGGVVANAMVLGVIPGTRAVILTDRLLETLRDDELDAVVAHEIGHIKRNHLLWFIVVILASFTLGGLLVEPLWSLLLELLPLGTLASSQELIRFGISFAIGLWIFGFASRRFERQADAFAVQLLSAGERTATPTKEAISAVSGALARVCDVSGVAPSRHSWRHGSIQSRINAVVRLEGVLLTGFRIDQVVVGVKVVALIVATLGVVDALGVR